MSDKHPQREKTAGEKKFDWMVYGGIGWVANAAISACVTFALYRVKAVKNGFEKHIVQPLIKWKPLGWSEKTIRDGIFGTTLCSGGTLLVPFMKYFEDKKSSIVRKWDEEIYGKERVENDAAIIQAHADMESAPKQSWTSMIGARIAVIGIAFGMGKTIGAHDSSLGKFADKNLPLVKGVASFERIGASATRTLMKASDWFTHDVLKLKTKPIMDRAVAKTSPVKILEHEHNGLHAGEIIGYELTQSSTIALIFYGISKTIAGIFDRPEANPRHIPTSVSLDGAAHRKRTTKELAEPVSEAPAASVSNITHEKRLNEAPSKATLTVAA